MMRAALFCLLLLTGCSAPHVAEPLLVGPGPCESDSISRDAGTGRVLSGCVALLLVEATRDESGSEVQGRVLVAGTLEPLGGVNVVTVGAPERGVSTDARGRFTLSGLRPDDRLALSYVGFWPDTLNVTSLPGPRRGHTD